MSADAATFAGQALVLLAAIVSSGANIYVAKRNSDQTELYKAPLEAMATQFTALNERLAQALRTLEGVATEVIQRAIR